MATRPKVFVHETEVLDEIQQERKAHSLEEDASALKPCPFCDSEEIIIAGDHATLSARSELYVECKRCGARGPVIEVERHKGKTAQDVNSAIHWWNRRTLTWTSC